MKREIQNHCDASVILHADGCGVPPGRLELTPLTGNEHYRIEVTINEEPMTRADWTTHDYNVHFCFGMENRGNRPIKLEISVNEGSWDALPAITPLLYEADAAEGPFRPSQTTGRTDLGTRYALRLIIDPGKRLYLANHYPRPLKVLVQTFDALGVAGGAKSWSIGETLLGLPITAYQFGKPGDSAILVVSGVHPPEPDTFATEAIMEWLSSDAGRARTERLTVIVVPVANPDGFAGRTQAANAANINFFWDFAADRAAKCPEAASLLRLAEELRPRAYIDIHGYTFQLRKEAGPYTRPALFNTSPEVCAAAARLYESMVRNDGCKAVTGFSTYAPQTLGSMLAERFDTLTVSKFHVHLKDSVYGCREQGLRAFQRVAAAVAGLPPDLPARKPSFSVRTMRRGREYWAGFLRPFIGNVRRGRFDQLNLTRRATVVPTTPSTRATRET